MAVKTGSKYEWIRGDYEGNVDEVSKIEGGFIIFKSGRRCNVDVFEEYLLPAGQVPLVQKTNHVQHAHSQSGTTSKGVTMVQFEQDEDNNYGEIIDAATGEAIRIPTIQPGPNITANTNVSNLEQPVHQPVQEKKVNPITLLINQASKDDCELNLNYNVKIPKKGVYKLLVESFEDVDIDNEILDTIISEININELRDFFRKELLEKIKLHYKL